ncbi:MAG: exodeoxyribonuclease VII large subunit, partial [Betaproteobacteria bacterium]|nr:exodeoxyribonuclease VII large subunit [Betaproteobacteria bacterium]
RAPTPTAAAQMASPNRDDLCQEIGHLYQSLARLIERALERRMQQLDVLTRRLTHPGERIANQLQQLGHLASRLRGAWRHAAGNHEWRLRERYRQLLVIRPDFDALATRQQTLAQRLASAAAHRVETLEADVRSLAAQLAQLNPRAVLERGYSMVETAAGVMVRDSAQLNVDDEVRMTFASGWAKAKVLDKG